MNFESWFQTKFPSIPLTGAHAVLKLVDEGGTIPFIARYRKDHTGNLDEVAVAQTIEAKELWENLTKRKAYVLKEIESQGKLSQELQAAIESCTDIDRVEDYYLPYKKKRKTKAVIAREAGLQPLADWIWDAGHGTHVDQTLVEYAGQFVSVDNGVPDSAAALDGARHILIERLSERVDLRQYVRERVFAVGGIKSVPGEKQDDAGKFEQYLDYEESIESLLKPQNSHRYLAIRRGESENILSLKICGLGVDAGLEDELMGRFQSAACNGDAQEEFKEVLHRAARFAFKLYVMPSIESEAHRVLKDAADQVAIDVFAENVRKVLLAPPLGSKAVLGVDPGLKTGCKLALIEDSGKFIANSVVYMHKAEDKQKCIELLKKVHSEYGLSAVAVGNGTGSREAETFFREAVASAGLEKVHVVVVNESGASIYSASEVARNEFPELDLTVRGAISIARRLQDPLAELVKIDPKSIGVGQYQHDVNQGALKKSLGRVVESCVNSVGVDLNTASEHLLAYVAGVGTSLAKSIVEHRSEKGLFSCREDLKSVSRFGGKAYEQSAGFLRIQGALNPLDNTGVHPEHYQVLQEYVDKQGKQLQDLLGAGAQTLMDAPEMKECIGSLALADIVRELEKPGRDPRESFVPFSFKEGIHSIKDLKLGMRCPGIVTNVTNFGAFVDVGVHQDGLIHISQLSDNFVKDPREILSPGDKVTVVVTEVDEGRKRIGLSMRSDAQRAQGAEPRRAAEPKAPKEGREAKSSAKRGKSVQRPSAGRPQNKKKDEFVNTPFAALKNLIS
jgi:uncharacterized protein